MRENFYQLCISFPLQNVNVLDKGPKRIAVIPKLVNAIVGHALKEQNATNVRVGSTAFHRVNHANATQVDQEMVTSVMPKLVNVIASQGSQVITAPNVD